MAPALTVYHYLRDFDAKAAMPNDGMSKAVAGLAGGLCGHGVMNVILCEGPGSLSTRQASGVEIRRFDNSSTRSSRFALAPGLRQFVDEVVRTTDLVILNAMFHTSVMLLSKEFRRRGIRYIAAPHDPYHPAVFSGGRLKKLVYWHLFERPMLQHAEAVQVLDRRHGDFLRARSIKTSVIEVFNGAAPVDVPAESSLTWRANGAPSILFLGRIDTMNKGIDLLLDAFAILPAEFQNSTLTIQGPDRGERAALEVSARERGVQSRVRFLEPDYSTRPGDLAAQHDIFCLPSRFEGFGLSAMEAMLAGRPVVISDVAGLAPHVEKCRGGAVVKATVESIRDGLVDVMRRRADWHEIGVRGRRYVLENLDWNRIAAGALPLYRNIMQLRA